MSRSIRRSFLILSACAASVSLAGCGEDWTPQPIIGTVPYTMERTAGHGIAYVRNYMMPEKGPKLEPVATPIEPTTETVLEPVDEPLPMSPAIRDAEPIFDDSQLKGSK